MTKSGADFLSKLRAAAVKRDSMLCIGLDPELNATDMNVQRALADCQRLIDATSDIACCYKPNSAFWEQYGPRGWQALASLGSMVPPDIPVLLDCKRADVPNTMAAYASAAFEAMQFDAATIHAYHGVDSISKFTDYASRGVYVVCHTSNPGNSDLQHLRCPERPLYMAVAELAHQCDQNGNVGLVLGATCPREVAIVRQSFPTKPFLLPGIGRQGGNLTATVNSAWTGDPASCLIAVAGAIM